MNVCVLCILYGSTFCTASASLLLNGKQNILCIMIENVHSINLFDCLIPGSMKLHYVIMSISGFHVNADVNWEGSQKKKTYKNSKQ